MSKPSNTLQSYKETIKTLTDKFTGVYSRSENGLTNKHHSTAHSQCVLSLAGNTDHKKATTPLRVFVQEFLAKKRISIKESTYNKYVSNCDLYILPKLGDIPINLLSSSHIEQFVFYLLNDKHLSAKTTKDILVLAKGILRFVTKRQPDVLMQIEIDYPTPPRQEMRVLSMAEQKQLTQFLWCDPNLYKLGMLFALETGIRIGELCALRWADISFEDRTVYIHETMSRQKCEGNQKKTHIVIGPPKSPHSTRLIPLTETTLAICEKMQPAAPSAFVLSGSEKFVEPRTMQYWISKYTQVCGLEGVHFHTLRHTFATRCVEVDFEIKSLSEILGHSCTRVTLDKYVHSSMQLKRQNMEKLSEVGL